MDISKSAFRKCAFWGSGRGYGQKLFQKLHFKHVGDLAVDMGKSVLRKCILSILGSRRGYGQKLFQELHFKHVGDLAVDMGKSGFRRCILSIVGAWPWIWAKVCS